MNWIEQDSLLLEGSDMDIQAREVKRRDYQNWPRARTIRKSTLAPEDNLDYAADDVPNCASPRGYQHTLQTGPAWSFSREDKTIWKQRSVL